jgi:heat shock protein HslJ
MERDMKLRRLVGRALRWALAGATLMSIPVTAQSAFPFDHELLLDAAPMRGGKKLPSLDITSDGRAEIALWCNTVQAQLVIAGDTITILTGSPTGRQCEPERMRADDDMLAALTQATNWRRDGDTLVLTGGRPLRFLLQTN